jgi:hypothetical protein
VIDEASPYSIIMQKKKEVLISMPYLQKDLEYKEKNIAFTRSNIAIGASYANCAIGILQNFTFTF